MDYHLSDTGKIDAWGSILILPIFGLFADGAWKLEESNIVMELEVLPAEESAVKTDAETEAEAAPEEALPGDPGYDEAAPAQEAAPAEAAPAQE